MLGVDFDPMETRAHFFEARMNQVAAFERNVRVLSTPDVQKFAFDLAGAFERIVFHALAEAMPGHKEACRPLVGRP